MRYLTAIIMATLLACSAKGQDKFAFRWPVRVIDGKKTDLNYLFSHWQTQQTNAVTNSLWMRVGGKVIQESATRWIVEGGTYTADFKETRQKFVLLNAPEFEKEKFDTSQAELLKLDEQFKTGGGRQFPGMYRQEELGNIVQSLPNNGNEYRVDVFALFTGKYENGMPVFDFGMISQ